MSVRVALAGFGEMGREALRALEPRADAEVVAVYDINPCLVGRPLGEFVPGCRWPAVVVEHPEQAGRPPADVAVHATTAFAAEAQPQLEDLLRCGLDVVTICQELVFPIAERVAIAERIDAIARAAGKTVVAAGVNPGWVLDVLPIAASLGCVDVRRVACRRVVDFSPYGADEMAHIGAGLTEREFRAGVEAGGIGHIGLLESAAMVAASIDLEVDQWAQTKEPLLATRTHVTKVTRVLSGRVRGFVQRVVGLAGGEEVLDFEMRGLLDPGDDDPALGDQIRVDGRPEVDLRIRSALAQRGGEGTAGVATNLIGPVLAAAPGLVPLRRLPLARSRRRLAMTEG